MGATNRRLLESNMAQRCVLHNYRDTIFSNALELDGLDWKSLLIKATLPSRRQPSGYQNSKLYDL